MNLGELREEVKARGYDYIADTRLNRWINQVEAEIAAEHHWPWTDTTTTGTAPLSITDLGVIVSVTDTTNDYRLERHSREELIYEDPDLDDTGNPIWYFRRGDTIHVHPLNTTATLSVRYHKRPTAITSDATQLIVPTQWQDLIVDGVVVKCLKDNDEYAAAMDAQSFYEAQVERMRNHYLSGDFATETITVTHFD